MSLNQFNRPEDGTKLHKDKPKHEYVPHVSHAIDILKLDLAPQDIQNSVTRVVEQYDKVFKTPALSDVPALKSALDTLQNDQKSFDQAKAARNSELKGYSDLKGQIEALVKKMGATQSSINLQATKDPAGANNLRNEFIKSQNQYNQLTTQLSAKKPLLEQRFEQVSTALTTLIASKQTYSNTVIAERKSTWDTIVNWNTADLTEYQGTLSTQQSEFKTLWDQGVGSSATLIENPEKNRLRERIANKKLERLDTKESDFKSEFYKNTYDLISIEGINSNKKLYQTHYLNQLQSQLKNDLAIAQISDDSVSILTQALNARTSSSTEPTLNKNASLQGQSKTKGIPSFDYSLYTNSLFAAQDPALQKLESQDTGILDFNTKLIAFVEGLGTNETNVLQIDTINQSVGREIYNAIVEQLTESTSSQLVSLATDANLNQASLRGKILLYRNSVINYYTKLVDIQQQLESKLQASTSPIEKNKLQTSISQLRVVRGELYNFGVVTPDDIQKNKPVIYEMIKDDPINREEQSRYNLVNLLSVLPQKTTQGTTVTSPTLTSKTLTWNPSDTVSVELSNQAIVDQPASSSLNQKVIDQKKNLVEGYKEEVDPINTLFRNFEVSYQSIIADVAKFGITNLN